MSTSARRWLTWGAAGLAVGVALGLFVGWWLWPLRYAGASPANFRSDYYDDYVLMIAQAYQVDGDLQAALERLSTLDPLNPSKPLLDLLGTLVEAGGGAKGGEDLSDLAAALGSRLDDVTIEGESP